MARRGRYPGPGYDESGGIGNPVVPPKKASTKYSPAPMSAKAKAKAAAQGRLTAMATKSGSFSKKITPPAKKSMTSGGKAFTPAEIAKLRKMLKG
jgi:hypothetical protein